MPFPILHRDTFEPTGVMLEPNDYFNPLHNAEYNYPGTQMTRLGFIKIGDAITIAKNLIHEESIETLISYIGKWYSGSNSPETRNLLYYAYEQLPADQKWLIFYCRIAYAGESLDQIQNYQFSFRYPERVSYGESSMNGAAVSPHIPCKFDMFGTLEITDPGKAILDVELPRAYAIAETNLHNFSEMLVSWNDGSIPGIIQTVYKYSQGGAVFHPEGNAADFPVGYDYTTPAVLRTYLNDGYRVTLKLHPNGAKLSFSVRHNAGDRRALERVLNYSANIFDYLPYTIKGPKEPQAVLYGVELEANGDYEPKDLIRAQKDLFFIMKQDGSVWGSKRYNYELVTVPASLKAHKRLWAEFFEKVDYNKFDTTKDTGNGMHVHIDRKAFKRSHLNRFTWFITNPANDDFILAMSERPNRTNLDQWAGRPNHLDHPTKLKAASIAERSNRGIRGAVHFKHDKTVEVRLFKGIVSYATVVKNLEFVDSVFHYTLHTALSQLSLKHYLAWLEATPKNKYQMLKAFIAEIKLVDTVAAAEVVDLVWSTKAEHIIAEKLNKAPFKVSNTHITYLNKKRRKRTFILKNGIVQCVAASGGLLAKLDKSVQQKQTRGAATFAMTNFAA